MWANLGHFLFIFAFSKYNDKYRTKFEHKRIDGVLGIRTWDRRMVGADKSTKVWWSPWINIFVPK